MNNLVLIVNTITNIPALFASYELYKKSRYVGVVLSLSSFTASCLMHITETKHNLIPFVLKEFSNTFLNTDRILTLLLSLYGLFLYGSNYDKVPFYPLLLRGSIGIVCLRLGELTSNLVLYTLLHTIWHYCSYSSLQFVASFS